MLQQAIFHIPNRGEGYTTDDNARLLIFTVLLEDWHGPTQRQSDWNCGVADPDWPFRYLSFLQQLSMRTRSDSVTFLAITTAGWKKRGSEDSHGPRALRLWERCCPIRQSGLARRDRTFI